MRSEQKKILKKLILPAFFMSIIAQYGLAWMHNSEAAECIRSWWGWYLPLGTHIWALILSPFILSLFCAVDDR